jgi:predicted enzyme related to lactoylglutathione lyase
LLESEIGECQVPSPRFVVNIDVDDLETAADFYRRAFGLKEGLRFGANGMEMLGGSAPIYLLVKLPGTAPAKAGGGVRHYDRHWTPVHLDFVVDDLDSAVRRVMKAGGRLEEPISTFIWGRLALMADPFGHGFCVVQFLGRGYDDLAERV